MMHARWMRSCLAAIMALTLGVAAAMAAAPAGKPDAAAAGFQDTFRVNKAKLSDTGEGTYFILIPGYKLTFQDGKDTLIITVLDETKMVDGVKCRIVEERETKGGKLEEISRNYFAIDKATGDAYYFGEDVDMYDKDGKVTGHEGRWLSGVDGARFGMLVPGKPMVGARYQQEVAPKAAMDRAEVVSITEKVKVPAGTFTNCLRTKESSGLESGVEEKLYAPEVGLLKDGGFELAKIEKPKVELPAAAAAETYTNPVIPGENLADPTVLLYEGTYYLYPTGAVKQGYVVYTSKDLVNWTKGPQVFDSGRPNTWAPDVSYNPDDRKFYLWYTADWKIGVAVADRPEGPFVDKGVFVTGAIDAHLFRDDDGKMYLYYTVGCTRMCVQPMASPTEKKGDPLELFRPAQGTWETKNGAINEGPWMIKHGGKYYLIYSGSGADTPDYAEGYAVATSPLGPFEKAKNNPVVERGPGLFGPGHGCAVKDAAGKWWFVYHQKKNDGRNFLRDVCIDPLWFDAEGNLRGKATRGTPEPAPARK